MEQRHLETFLAIVRDGGFARAAESLNCAPSTITLRINELERDLKIKLFRRSGRKAQLTEAGEVLRRHAESVLLDFEWLAAAMRDARDGSTGKVRIGTIEPTASRRLPAVLAEFCRTRPQVRLSVEVGGTARIAQAVLQGDLDVGISSSPPQGLHLQFEPLFIEELVLLVPRGHRLADARLVDAAKLTTERLLVTEEGCAYRQTVLSGLAARGVRIASILEIGSVNVLAEAVATGLGVAIVPLAGATPRKGTVIKRLRTPLTLVVGTVTRPSAETSLPTAASAFVRLIQTRLKS